MDNNSLSHVGILGMKWGRRKHPDRKDATNFQRGNLQTLREKARGVTRLANEKDVKRAVSRGFIRKPLKKEVWEMSNRELSNLLKPKHLQRQLKDIDERTAKTRTVLLNSLFVLGLAGSIYSSVR